MDWQSFSRYRSECAEERERIAAARQAISDARLLLETALLFLDRKTSEERPCPTE